MQKLSAVKACKIGNLHRFKSSDIRGYKTRYLRPVSKSELQLGPHRFSGTVSIPSVTQYLRHLVAMTFKGYGNSHMLIFKEQDF